MQPDNAVVTLQSTLKQGSLCPGDEVATFTCTARGTELTWVVNINGTLMNYNAHDRVGSIRSNIDEDQRALLSRVDDIGENGVASRISVLIITAQSSATDSEAFIIMCCNGSREFTEEQRFLRRVASRCSSLKSARTIHYHDPLGPPSMPTVSKNPTNSGKIHLNWTVPELDDTQTIDYYTVMLDEHPPLWVKNTSVTLFTEELASRHVVRIRAIDSCGQKGQEVTVVIRFQGPETAVPTTTHSTMTTNSIDSKSTL